ncbi:MAG: hypothetical protein IPF44_11410 [Betaproteobacteria bacterium]|nr:hypothetical protein [Betaproteobacteria bacterium]
MMSSPAQWMPLGNAFSSSVLNRDGFPDISAGSSRSLPTAGHDVHVETLAPETPFPFPWPIVQFFDAFPECVRQAHALRALEVAAGTTFDLVILTLSGLVSIPRLPMTAFLKSEEGRKLIDGKPVITLVACRNMWLSAQETMKLLIADAGGRLIDHLTSPAGATPATSHPAGLGWPAENQLSGTATSWRITKIRQAGRFGLALAGSD